jgi:steroid delta-isomerase-like uncharacterized protein
VWNTGKVDRIDDIYAADSVYHDAFGEVHDRESMKEYVTRTRETFPDFHVREDDRISDGGTVATRYTIRGTMERRFRDFQPTGKSFEVHGIATYRVEDGRIVEAWNAVNAMAMAEQLGLLDGD